MPRGVEALLSGEFTVGTLALDCPPCALLLDFLKLKSNNPNQQITKIKNLINAKAQISHNESTSRTLKKQTLISQWKAIRLAREIRIKP